MVYRVAYLGPNYNWLHDLIREELPEGFHLCPLRSKTKQAQYELVENADFVVALYADAELIHHMNQAKLIQYHGTGYHGKIDLAACRSAGIPLATAPGGNTIEVAEHAILLILSTLRLLPDMHNAVKHGKWPMWERRQQLHNLEGKSIGIVGLGRIGREIARKLKAFDTKLYYYDTLKVSTEVENNLEITYIALDELISIVDLVVLSVPITPSTRGLINEDRLRMMKKTSFLINVSRGEVVNQDALVRALHEGWIAGAGLDVFEKEPVTRDCPLLKLDNVVLTPHVASGTIDSLRKKAKAWATNFERVLNGLEPNDLVPESVLPVTYGK